MISDRAPDDDRDRDDVDVERETDAAASEASHIGGEPGGSFDPAERAVREAGGGEAEGFEMAEEELVEHASHGDQQGAHAILHHQGDDEEQADEDEDERRGEADHIHISEVDDS